MSEKYPIVPLRDIVIFPNVSSPLLIGRKASVKALDKVGENGYLFVVAQKDPIVEEVKDSDLYNYGTVVKVIHITNIADDTYKILVEGEYRAKVLNYSKRSGIMFAEVEPIVPEYEDDDEEIVAIVRMVKEVFEEYVSLHKKLSLVIPLSLSSLKEAEEVVQGAAIIARILGLDTAVIGVEENKPDAIAKLKEVAPKYNISVQGLPVNYLFLLTVLTAGSGSALMRRFWP
jgi:ATP-dependent Lon protease